MSTFTVRIEARRQSKFAPKEKARGEHIDISTVDGVKTTGHVIDSEVIEGGRAMLVTIETDKKIPDVEWHGVAL